MTGPAPHDFEHRSAAAATHTCSVHGVGLSVTAGPEVLAALQARLEAFPLTGGEGPRLDFEFLPADDPRSRHVARPAGHGRRVLDLTTGSVDYFPASQMLFVELGARGRALCDVRARRVLAAYPATDENGVWVAAHPLFTIPLAELLKREGRFMVHAAGLARDGRGLLVPGASGAGKTTLTLALLRSGFGFLADDTVFLTQRPRGATPRLAALAFPDEVDLTEQTAAFFPELVAQPDRPSPAKRPKRAVSALRVYGVTPVWECPPVALVFPQIAPVSRSVLTPISPDEALLQLLCNVVRTDTDASQAHLNALGVLVQQCACLRLQTGRDFAALPDLLAGVLQPNWPA
jgi:hypothetical protein